jgi:lysine 2,3-aminomutase
MRGSRNREGAVRDVACVSSSKLYANVSASDFQNHFWQDKNSVTRFQQLETLLQDAISPAQLNEIGAGLGKVGMSIRLNPYVMSLIDWANVETDPVRRQFLPMRSELEDDHPCLAIDSLEERETSPVPGLVHRYPDKALFLVTSVCPVYCQYCTRSYAVGQDTALVQKDNVTSAQNWTAAFEYLRNNRGIEDVVVSGGDVARLKPANIRLLGNTLLDIENIRRIRFATKAVSVQPQKILTDDEWFRAIVEVVQRGRSMFKDVCVHTHFNHPNEVTPQVEQAMRRLHNEGVYVRNQAVLLRGVNDNARTLIELIRKLGRVNIHPYYVYLCDMVMGTEHFRLPLSTAQELEKEVRGHTAGFNTPLFVCDAPGGGGKRDVHSAEFHDQEFGISGFRSPAVDPHRTYYYLDPLRSLGEETRAAWRMQGGKERIMAKLGLRPRAVVAAE